MTTNESANKLRVRMVCRYGPLRRGLVYEVIHDGLDYWLLRVQGRSVYASKSYCKIIAGPESGGDFFENFKGESDE